MIALRHPLLLLLTMPLLLWAWRVVYRWGIPSSRPSSILGRHSSHWIPVLLTLALSLAATGPEWRTPLRGTAPVVDFAVVLDGSSSMRILDRPEEDRWHAARRTLAQFILRRPDDRFALILFSAHPVTLSPLTSDHLRLLRMLARLDIDSRDDGTAIGSGLMTAVRRLEDSPARSRVILLITDGVQNRGRVTPLEAAEEARRSGIRIHAVAIGTNGESLVPLEGGGFARLQVEVDHSTLEQVAHLTGGESFSAEDPAGLEHSLASVDQLEKTLLPVDPPTEGHPLALWFLLAAAFLALPLALDLAFKRGRLRPGMVGRTMSLPVSHPWLLAPFGAMALLTLALALRAQLRPGLGVQVVGQRPIWQGLGLALMLTGLGLGLAEPRWGSPEFPRLTVHVVLDASRSMTVPDAGGRTRWEAALAALDRIWSRPQPGLRWSLDLLTGDAIPVQPPGEDRTLLREALRAATPGDIGSPGTSLGRGLLQVAAQADREAPAVILLLSDGEETWEAPEAALGRAVTALRQSRLPVCVMALGDGQPHAVPSRPGSRTLDPEPVTSTSHPEFLAHLAEGTGGQVFVDGEAAAAGLQALATGRLPLPARRSLQPAHPEVGAWLALVGLVLWLGFAGKPLAKWRPILLLLLAIASRSLSAQDPGSRWAPATVRAWLAQRAIDGGDLTGARRWRPVDAKPAHVLLAAQIDLQTGFPEDALKVLAPLVGQGSPRPIPTWRAPALLLAARAHWSAQRPEEARALLERLLLEQPGQHEAIHNLQTLVKDALPPPPPDPRKPPPPPPPRPSLGAQQDELEGLKQRLPKPPETAGGVKDL